MSTCELINLNETKEGHTPSPSKDSLLAVTEIMRDLRATWPPSPSIPVCGLRFQLLWPQKFDATFPLTKEGAYRMSEYTLLSCGWCLPEFQTALSPELFLLALTAAITVVDPSSPCVWFRLVCENSRTPTFVILQKRKTTSTGISIWVPYALRIDGLPDWTFELHFIAGVHDWDEALDTGTLQKWKATLAGEYPNHRDTLTYVTKMLAKDPHAYLDYRTSNAVTSDPYQSLPRGREYPFGIVRAHLANKTLPSGTTLWLSRRN